MNSIEHIIVIIAAYLLGSVPTSVWVGRAFYKKDVREYGSKNAGASNTFRVLGKKAGIPVLIFDIFKGWAAVNLIFFTDIYIEGSIEFINLQLGLGVSALIGHISPIYVGFRGGKGVATLFGAVIAIEPITSLIALSIFIIILLITRYVSLSSMVAGFSFPILIIIIFEETNISIIIFSMVIAILLLSTHQKNIERLLSKKESKAKFIFKNKKDSEPK